MEEIDIPNKNIIYLNPGCISPLSSIKGGDVIATSDGWDYRVSGEATYFWNPFYDSS